MTNKDLLEPYSDEEREQFTAMFNETHWPMLDILNTYFYVKDFKALRLILDTASALALNPSEIASVLVNKRLELPSDLLQDISKGLK